MNEVTYDMHGWLYRLIQEGWLRKRWRKRWCILNNNKLMMFEYKTMDENDVHCGKINLDNYTGCSNAHKRDCKKSQFTFVLEPKDKKKTKRELFYLEDSKEFEQWVAKLDYSVTIVTMGARSNLDHVTKTRAKPAAANRRPPTRQHLKERAKQSDVDFEPREEVIKPKKRGHVPEKAMKPPSGLTIKPATINTTPLNQPIITLTELPPPSSHTQDNLPPPPSSHTQDNLPPPPSSHTQDNFPPPPSSHTQDNLPPPPTPPISPPAPPPLSNKPKFSRSEDDVTSDDVIANDSDVTEEDINYVNDVTHDIAIDRDVTTDDVTDSLRFNGGFEWKHRILERGVRSRSLMTLDDVESDVTDSGIHSDCETKQLKQKSRRPRLVKRRHNQDE
uniref:wiskott-Aldrich syndrome protein family member 2 isoform X2 n=1 Tax=Ciona intestinalis TaxID=7719 RepID=UPI0002B8D685|nr:wiskott-Aldrich syndrome protein family member 2 isoform X2 [Ciona intestinalis]|eukprot:XP_002127177.2 wiskott-Aldrich syndrome protein family member 2 isoform X2 [Ciona intestinalis]